MFCTEERMKFYKCIFLTLAIFWLLSSTLATAQTAAAPASAGSLRGTVTDPSGAAISGADVVLTPSSSSALIKTKSDGQGAYEFKALPPGQYTLTIVAQGFSVY